MSKKDKSQSTCQKAFRVKPPVTDDGKSPLKRCLTFKDLFLVNMGSILGSGVYSAVGLGAFISGPSIIFSFLLTIVCNIFTSFPYVEFAARIEDSGATYSFLYATLGEMVAFINGLAMTFNYAIVSSAVSRGWSSYLAFLLKGFGVNLPRWLYENINIISGLLVFLMMLIMLKGVKDSVNFNNVISLLNCVNIFLILMVGFYYMDTTRFHPFFPDGDPTRMLNSIGLTYFSVIGFDAAALYSKETINPKKTIPLAITASILCSGAIYILVAIVAIGLAPLKTLNTNQGLVMAFEYVGKTYFSKFISIGSLIGITTSTFVNLLCQPRVFLSISNDGLMPSKYAEVNNIGVPAKSTYLSGLIAIPISFLFDIDILANVISIACLLAYGLVSLSCIKCRYENAPFPRVRIGFLIAYCIISIMLGVASVNNWPMEVVIVSVTLLLGISIYIYLHDQTNMPTKFACPGMPFIPLIAILSIFYIFGTISLFPHILFAIFIIGACTMYFKYSIHHSMLNSIKKD